MTDSMEFDPTIDVGRIARGPAGTSDPANISHPASISDPARTRDTIGPYRIIGKLGEGGMGFVYEAEQQQPKRRVALKVVKGGEFVDPMRVRLFQREVETLARMKHPNIAAIHDAGVSDTGEHYFAMELARGETLDVYLNTRPAPDREEEIRFRLRLFRTIADAVNYAHQRGVIHRDLKPANIIVTEADDDRTSMALPVVKILDFGLARLAESDSGQTMMTEVGIVRGTLSYMSPEQARGNPDDVDLRCDVYSLGIILYEMMSGTRPYDVRSSSLYDAIKIICEDRPMPLSRAWAGTRRVDQDIETIVHHALEKDVEQRYPSAGALSEDVGLYLESRPIKARPPSRLYLARKFAIRNRGMVIGGTVAFLALAGGVIASTTFGLREAAQHRAADEAREGMQTVVEFQQEMLSGVDAARMGVALSDDLRSRLAATLREEGAAPRDIDAALRAFDAGISRISMTDAALQVIDTNILKRALTTVEARFADRPLVRAGLLQSIGDTYGTLGLLPEADSTLQAAQRLYTAELGATSMKTIDVTSSLANLYSSGGEFEKAEPLHHAVVEARRSTLGADDPKTLSAIGAMALMYGDQERSAEAESLYTMAMTAMIRKVGEEDRETLNIMNNYAWFLYQERRYAEAESLCTRTLAIRRRVLGPDHVDTQDSINNLAVLYRQTDRLDEAEPLFREGYEASRRLLGDEHPNTLPAMSNLGRLLIAQGKFDEAELILRRASVTARKILPAGFFGRGVILQSWGESLVAMKRYAEAEEPMLEAYSILMNLNVEGPGIPRAVESMVRIYENTGRTRQAAEWRAKLPVDEIIGSG